MSLGKANQLFITAFKGHVHDIELSANEWLDDCDDCIEVLSAHVFQPQHSSAHRNVDTQMLLICRAKPQSE